MTPRRSFSWTLVLLSLVCTGCNLSPNIDLPSAGATGDGDDAIDVGGEPDDAGSESKDPDLGRGGAGSTCPRFGGAGGAGDTCDQTAP